MKEQRFCMLWLFQEAVFVKTYLEKVTDIQRMYIT